jgi:hypothetical protein
MELLRKLNEESGSENEWPDLRDEALLLSM